MLRSRSRETESEILEGQSRESKSEILERLKSDILLPTPQPWWRWRN